MNITRRELLAEETLMKLLGHQGVVTLLVNTIKIDLTDPESGGVPLFGRVLAVLSFAVADAMLDEASARPKE